MTTSITNDDLSTLSINRLSALIQSRLDFITEDYNSGRSMTESEILGHESEMEVLTELLESLGSDRGHGILDDQDLWTLHHLCIEEANRHQDKLVKLQSQLNEALSNLDRAKAESIWKKVNDQLWNVEKFRSLATTCRDLDK